MHAPTSRASDECVAEGTRVFDRIFVLIDFTTLSCHRALGVAVALRRAFASRICLFHMPELSGGDEFLAGIGSPSVVGADLQEETKGRLSRFVQHVAPEVAGQVELRAALGVNVIESLKKEAIKWRAS